MCVFMRGRERERRRGRGGERGGGGERDREWGERENLILTDEENINL